MKLCDVKLSDFIRWLVDETKEINDDDLYDLTLQYASALKLESFEKRIRLLIQISQNKTRYQLAVFCIKMLEEIYMPEAVKELKALGIHGEYNPDIPVKYFKELQSAYSRSKAFLQLAIQKEAELEMLLKNDTAKSEKVTRESFDENLISLSKFFGYNIREDEISVQKYCLMIKRMESYGQTDKRPG